MKPLLFALPIAVLFFQPISYAEIFPIESVPYTAIHTNIAEGNDLSNTFSGEASPEVTHTITNGTDSNFARTSTTVEFSPQHLRVTGDVDLSSGAVTVSEQSFGSILLITADFRHNR